MHLRLDSLTMFGFSSTTTLLASTLLGVSATLKMLGSNGLLQFPRRRSSLDCQLHQMQLGAVSSLQTTLNLRSSLQLKTLPSMVVLCCGQSIMMTKLATANPSRTLSKLCGNRL
ncbi:hypothetical protein LINPERPRIM_LOCUS9957 [Linum perenne]